MIAHQRQNKQVTTTSLTLNNEDYIDDNIILGFKEHFGNLALPLQSSNFDNDFNDQVNANVLLIGGFCTDQNSQDFNETNVTDIKMIICSFQNKK